jgi:hypothetical protein
LYLTRINNWFWKIQAYMFYVIYADHLVLCVQPIRSVYYGPKTQLKNVAGRLCVAATRNTKTDCEDTQMISLITVFMAVTVLRSLVLSSIYSFVVNFHKLLLDWESKADSVYTLSKLRN